MPHYGYFPFGFGLVDLLLIGLVVFLIVWLVVSLFRRDDRRAGPTAWPASPPGPPVGPPPPDPAVQILRERFARGEMTEAEFFSAARALGVPLPPPNAGTAPGPTPPAA